MGATAKSCTLSLLNPLQSPLWLQSLWQALKITVLLVMYAAGVSAALPTVQLDFYHTGYATQQLFSADKVALP